MDERILDKTDLIDKEEVYQKLCEFEKNYCEDIYEKSDGTIVYGIDPGRLSELENVPESELKNTDFSTVEFPSYKELFESKYKSKFLKNIKAINPRELQKELGKDILEKASKDDSEIQKGYARSIKELDLDNDGVPDRIDIDDTKNSVQTVADLDIVKNLTSKETSKERAPKKEKKKDELER